MLPTSEVLPTSSASDHTAGQPLANGGASELTLLEVGDYLYREQETRACIYRVDKGVIAVFEKHIGRPAGKIELAGRGDYIGLGCLEEYNDNARAVVDSVVRRVPRAEFNGVTEHDAKVRRKQAEAISREFEYRKEILSNRRHSTPTERVAAFLIAASRQNAYEGRDPTVISDSLKCGIVASLLDLELEALAEALLELETVALVAQHPLRGLHLNNIEALERFSNGKQIVDLPPLGTGKGH